jgi:phosphomannomutase (EC 5.4.2.8)
MDELTCFKAYDIRGEVGVNLTPDIAFRIGRAWAAWLHPRRVVVGADIRLSSETLKNALIDGLTASGVDVIDIGLSGTEEIYFATRELRADGGIQVTASHNPANYNGMKLVREEARPVSNDNGLLEVKALAEKNQFPPTVHRGQVIHYDNRPTWVACLLRFMHHAPVRPVTHCGQRRARYRWPGAGCAGRRVEIAGHQRRVYPRAPSTGRHLPGGYP